MRRACAVVGAVVVVVVGDGCGGGGDGDGGGEDAGGGDPAAEFITCAQGDGLEATESDGSYGAEHTVVVTGGGLRSMVYVYPDAAAAKDAASDVPEYGTNETFGPAVVAFDSGVETPQAEAVRGCLE